MPPLPVALILTSCFLHAGWNLLLRRRRRELVFLRHMLILTVPISAAALGVALLLPHSFPPKAWACVAASGAITGAYYWFLGLAYGSGDFTVVYPVARALPVLMVAGIDVARGRPPSAAGWLGMALVVAGCMLAPQASYRGFTWRRYHARDILWIVLTAATIAGFTMFDKVAAETVSRGPASAAVYCAWFHILSCASYLGILALVGRLREEGGRQVGWRWPAVGAAMGFVCYLLVLWAYQMAPQTGYLLAFRQFSIVIGVVAAFRIYGETGLSVRLPATAAIVGGLVLLAVIG
jgi:uncharacterized membrane protein